MGIFGMTEGCLPSIFILRKEARFDQTAVYLRLYHLSEIVGNDQGLKLHYVQDNDY